MTAKPTHRAYLVNEPDVAEGRKTRWTEVGAVWPHTKGGGFDVVLPPGLSVAGRIVCRPVTEDDSTLG